MRTSIFVMAVSALCLAEAQAQGPAFRPGPGGGSFGQPGVGGLNPNVSPYLNLYRRGSSLAVNYYGLVRPAIDIRGAVQNLQGEINDMPAPGTGGSGESFSPFVTSSRTRFLNTGNYFLSGAPVGSPGVGRMGSGLGGGFGGGGSGGVVIVNQQGAQNSAPQMPRMGGMAPTTGIRR